MSVTMQIWMLNHSIEVRSARRGSGLQLCVWEPLPNQVYLQEDVKMGREGDEGVRPAILPAPEGWCKKKCRAFICQRQMSLYFGEKQ